MDEFETCNCILSVRKEHGWADPALEEAVRSLEAVNKLKERFSDPKILHKILSDVTENK